MDAAGSCLEWERGARTGQAAAPRSSWLASRSLRRLRKISSRAYSRVLNGYVILARGRHPKTVWLVVVTFAVAVKRARGAGRRFLVLMF
jgi:hypothetical protein